MSGKLGDSQRCFRVAIIGSGPSGFYAADALLKREGIDVKVDMFDRLPSPYGLVRYGVAPDHAKIKSVTRVYENIAGKNGFSFLGNVDIGKDISVKELKEFYDAIIFATGSETDRNLGILGEDLKGSHTATEFVAWYNGHPDYQNIEFDLSQEVAVVIGQGNVAMDVCRILCKTVDELKMTDITRHALEVLAESKIKEVHIIGRRGPVQAAFAPIEIKEFGNLLDCDIIVNADDLQIVESSRIELEDSRNVQKQKNFQTLVDFSKLKIKNKKKRFILHFLKSPIELVGDARVEKVVFEKNKLVGDPGKQKAKSTGVTEEFPCGLFFRSVGYHGVPIAGVPFQEQRGIIPNQHGRIIDGDNVVPGQYVVGWIKRGPSGIIGTNKPDSEETVRHFFEDLDVLLPCVKSDTGILLDMLKEKNVRVVSFEDWKKIDSVEVEHGKECGKPREKFVTKEDMLSVICNV